jgi:hypothetical protein
VSTASSSGFEEDDEGGSQSQGESGDHHGDDANQNIVDIAKVGIFCEAD